MDVHRVRHDLRRDEGVDELLDDHGPGQGDKGHQRAHEDGRDGRERTSQPRADDGDDVHHAGDEAEHGRVGHADDLEQDAAAHADDGALQKRSLDVAAHDAGEGGVEELGVLGVLGADEPARLAAHGRQLHEDPEGDDEREP